MLDWVCLEQETLGGLSAISHSYLDLWTFLFPGKLGLPDKEKFPLWIPLPYMS